MKDLKVLFIGTYREVSGWGDAARKYITALDAAGVDVVPRVIRIRPEFSEPHPLILQLETKKSTGANVVIQNMLPHLMDYNGYFDKNIGLFYTETNNLGRSNWSYKLNSLDEIWVSNQQSVVCCERSNIKRPVNVIPIPCDAEVYKKQYPKVPMPFINDDTFLFYYIGEHTPRKNLQALMIAFHTEFTKKDNVSLLLKVGMMGQDEQFIMQQVGQFCEDIKGALRMHDNMENYIKEIILSQRITDEQLYSIHQRGDCFVLPSSGEGWSMPAFDALSFGKPVITSRKIAPQFMNDENSWLLDSKEEPVLFSNSPVRDLYTGHETWEKIDIMELRKTMRYAYTHRDETKTKGEAGRTIPSQYSYEIVGNQMKELLLK